MPWSKSSIAFIFTSHKSIALNSYQRVIDWFVVIQKHLQSWVWMQKDFSNSVVMVSDFFFVFYHFLKSLSWYFILFWASLFDVEIVSDSSLLLFYCPSFLGILWFAFSIGFCLFYCLFFTFSDCLPLWFLAHIIFSEFQFFLHFWPFLPHYWLFHHDSPRITVRILNNRVR